MSNPTSISAVAAAPNNDTGDISLGTLWDTLHDEFTNMGNALKCPLCLSTYQDAVILPCVHAYCRSCLKESLAQRGECPTCKTKCSRRSITAAPILNELGKAYKLALRNFGLAPVSFAPDFNGFTQIAPEEAEAEPNYGAGLTLQPYREQYSSRRKSRDNMLASHTQLLVSKCWQKVLGERQKQAEAFAKAKKSALKGKSLPGSTNQAGTHSWYQQQQEAVSKSHQRLLVAAVRKRHEPSPALDLSMRHEISIEEGLDDELANRQMEEEHEEWLRELAEREKQQKQPKEQTEDGIEEKKEEVERNLDGNENDSAKKAASNTAERPDTSSNHQPTMSSQGDAKPAAKPSASATQDFFTPREVDSQGSMLPNTQGAALTLLDMSLFRPGTSEHAQQQPALSAAESFDTATSKAQDSQKDNGMNATNVEDDTKMEAEEKQENTSTTEAKSNNYKNTSRTPKQSNIASRIGASESTSNEAVSLPVVKTHINDDDALPGGSVATVAPTVNNAASMPGVPFPVGALVKVQDRTWSGINRPGGIARVTKVVDVACCNVEYVLGGREKNVDFIYLSTPPEEMDWAESPTSGSRRGRKSKRVSTKVRVKTEEVDSALPPELIKQLAKEGFDVAAVAPAKKPAKASRGRTVRRVKIKPEKATTETQPAPESQSQPKQTMLVAGEPKSRARLPKGGPKRRARSNSRKPPVLKDRSTAEQKMKDDKAQNVHSSASDDASSTKATYPNKRRKTVVSQKPNLSPSSSKAELCSLASLQYRQRVQEDLDSSSLCILTTGLTAKNKSDLKTLCKNLKQNGKGHMKLSEVFNAQKTTMCILPAEPSKHDPSNVVAQCRTIKAMLCALHGIPLVDFSWIKSCQREGRLAIPPDSLWIRSLPVKTVSDENTGIADYGVAKMAVQASILGSHKVLQNFTAHLCGTFVRPPKTDVHLLLREAGAKLSLTNQSTVSLLKRMEAGSSLVLICDDDCATIDATLRDQIEITLKEYKAKEIFVVNTQWLFDSIAAGSALSMAGYAPAKVDGQPAAIWKALQP